MAYRIRTIKPEAWQSEQLCRVSRDARLLWVVLITMADDEGRFRWRPTTVLGHGFPDDLDAPALIDGWLGELVSEGLVVMYENGRATYGVHPKWADHQRINRASRSSLPGPSDEGSAPVHGVINERSVSAHAESPKVLTEPSLGEGKGSEGIGTEGMAAARATDWFDRCVEAGQERRLPWSTSLETLSEQRIRCEELFADCDDELARSVRRDVLDAVRGGQIRRSLAEAVRAFIGQAERRAAAPAPHPSRLSADEQRRERSARRRAQVEATGLLQPTTALEVPR